MAIQEARGDLAPQLGLIHRSKITIPPVSGIARPRLVARVEAGARGKLTVVSAPAGWGKSSLLAEWAAATPMNVAWVSLDEGDNDPSRYFRAVVAALDAIYPLQLDDVFAMLRSPSPAINDQIDQAIISRLEDFPSDTAIVLDDFHAITNPDQLRSFGRVLDYLPQHVHLVVATRGEVRIPLARLRSAGELTVLRAEDIAFSAPEASAVLTRMTGEPPEAADVALLVDRTEGWVAGLRLAGISLASQRDSRAMIERFRGTHRDIADYFREEVLACLEPDCRQFLVETSMLDTFTEALAGAVTDHRDAGLMLERIADAALFLVPLDEERQWYRYHALFREMLEADFQRLPEERQRALHGRASAWFERQQMINEAVSHALAVDDTDRAAALVERYADTLMYTCGESSLIVSWIERLPERLLAERPGLLRVFAWALTTIGRIDQADRIMNDVCEACLSAARGDTTPEAEIAAVKARIAAYRGDHRATITHGTRALALLDPVRDGRVYGDVVLSIGFAERALGHTDQAAERFAETARLGRLHGNGQAARWGARYLALTRISQGRLTEAEAIIDEELGRVVASDPGSTLTALLLTKGEILLERNRLQEAREHLERAFPIIHRVADAKMLMNAHVALGWLYQAEGNQAAAREKMRRAEEVFPTAVRGARAAHLALLQDNLTEARRWASLSGFGIDDEADPLRGEQEQVIFARIAAATDPDAALGLLQRLIDDAEAGGRHGRAIELLAIQAVALARCGQREAARRSLCRGLAYAHHEGFTRTFLNEGPEMRTVLRDLARDRGALDDAIRPYVMELLGQVGSDPGERPDAPATLDEPLTARQLEILQLLAAGQSNRDIANRLFIAEGTVKAHMHQLFGKLMARNRTEAVANARELHLLG